MLRSTRCATDARTEGCDACASSSPPPPPPSLTRVVHHHTIPRTYIFHGESPTFATIISVAAALVRATQARQVRRPHPAEFTRRPEAAIRLRVHRTRVFISLLRVSTPIPPYRAFLSKPSHSCAVFF